MKIPYKKSRTKFSLAIGLLWLAYGALCLWMYYPNPRPVDYAWPVFGILNLLGHFYQKKQRYVSVEDGVLSTGRPFSKALSLNDVVYARKFAGDITVRTRDAKLVINTNFIEPEGVAELENELRGHGVDISGS